MTPALALTGVYKAFGNTSIIRGVNLTIEPGTRQALIGPNGAGKSTLFNLITGKYPVNAGAIRLNGEDITGLTPYEVNRRGLSRSFQVTNIFPRMTVFENIRCGVFWSLGYRYSFWHRADAARTANQRAETVLEQLNLGARRHVPELEERVAVEQLRGDRAGVAGGAEDGDFSHGAHRRACPPPPW